VREGGEGEKGKNFSSWKDFNVHCRMLHPWRAALVLHVQVRTSNGIDSFYRTGRGAAIGPSFRNNMAEVDFY